MIKEIDKKLLIDNPFNPKNPFENSEYKMLKNSLKKWGFKGVLLIVPCYDEKNADKYYVLDGNSRYKDIKQELILCEIITGIKNDQQLKELTIDFCGAVKTRNYIKLLNLYKDVKSNLDDTYHDVFDKIKMNIDKYQEDQAKLRAFDKTVLLKFGEKKAYEDFELIKKNVKSKIYKNDKFLKALKKVEDDLTDDKIDKYLVDIILQIAGK